MRLPALLFAGSLGAAMVLAAACSSSRSAAAPAATPAPVATPAATPAPAAARPTPAAAPASGRVPREPLEILQRFRRTVSTKEFSGLGPSGRGKLTISGGLASYPWDGHDVREMVEKADQALTFGAKRGGKNSIYLVGGDEADVG